MIAILTRALGGEGKQAAVLVDSSIPRGQTMAGLFHELGYETQSTQTGMAGFKAATARMDVEFIALEYNIMRWGLSQTIANLRADSRTANIPIIIYGPLRLKTPELTGELRSEYRSAALYWLSHIASSQRSRIYDLTPAEKPLLPLVADRNLAANALITLGGIPTRTAQADLVTIVTNKTMDSDVKEIAALQLAFHIQKFGLLVDSKNVASIREAYQTATDPKLNTALASVMGTLMPDNKVVGERLQEFKPTTPLP